eukprot:8003154-Pyramimonas_sp.AAC.1
MRALVQKLKEVPEAAAAPEPPQHETQSTPPDRRESMDIDDDEDQDRANAHVDSLDGRTCREHLKECGIDVDVGGDDEEFDDTKERGLRDKLKRHLAQVHMLTKKFKTS